MCGSCYNLYMFHHSACDTSYPGLVQYCGTIHPGTGYMAYTVHSTIISPGSWVSYFTGNLLTQKTNKIHTTQENIIGVQYFWAYQQGVVSPTFSFIVYPLSPFYFPHNFMSNFPFSPPPPPPAEITAVILNFVSVPPGGILSPPLLLILHPIWFICWPFPSKRREMEQFFRYDRCCSAEGGTWWK